MAKLKGAPPKLPIVPAEWEPSDAAALQALARGEANAGQQQQALRWIIERGCETYGLSFRPGNDGLTAFAEGRRFVGLQIVKLLNLKLGILNDRSERGSG